MKELRGKNVQISDTVLLRRAAENKKYLLSLDSDKLLLNYRLEAGRPTENYGALPKDIHGGWEFPTCQLRGHFLGHWLSAAALEYDRTGDRELLGKAQNIVDELELCQIDNGGEWVASIPEKYFTWIGRGKNVWAPHYTVHKTFMGLIDVYKFMELEKALTEENLKKFREDNQCYICGHIFGKDDNNNESLVTYQVQYKEDIYS